MNVFETQCVVLLEHKHTGMVCMCLNNNLMYCIVLNCVVLCCYNTKCADYMPVYCFVAKETYWLHVYIYVYIALCLLLDI